MSTESTRTKDEFVERGEADRRSEELASSDAGERRLATADRRHENNRQYATFFLENHFLGVEVENVQEVFTAKEMTRVPLAPPVIGGLINLRGHIILTIDLRKRLGFNDRDEGKEVMSIVVRTDDGPVNLLVDQIGDVIEVRPDLFEPPPTTLDHDLGASVDGVYKLKDKLLLALSTRRVTQVVS
ncbi:MAG: chemotaxis protein CheW [Nitrospiria bacterium]